MILLTCRGMMIVFSPIQAVAKLLELYNKLYKMGNPHFLQSGSIHPIQCSKAKEEVEDIVIKMQHTLTKWNKKVSELRACFPWLLYFSIPKMMLLYKLIHSPFPSKKVVHEVSFLVTEGKGNLKKKVEVSIRNAFILFLL